MRKTLYECSCCDKMFYRILQHSNAKSLSTWQQTSALSSPRLMVTLKLQHFNRPVADSVVPLPTFLEFRGRLWAVPCGRKGSWKLDEALPGGQHLWGTGQHGQKSPEAVSRGSCCHELGPQQTAGQVRHVLHDRRHGVCVSGKQKNCINSSGQRVKAWFSSQVFVSVWKSQMFSSKIKT